MGLIGSLKDVLGLGAEAAARRAADPEDLFGMSTAHVTMAANLDLEPIDEAGLCFADVNSTDFASALRSARDIVQTGDAGTIAGVRKDDHGYHWVVMEDEDFEDLVVGVHAAADEFTERGYDSRLLAAVFGFEGPAGERAYWIYSFRRGSFYPFAPRAGQERDHELEFKLRSVLDGELDLETDESHWYPLWPDRDSGHPWGDPS